MPRMKQTSYQLEVAARDAAESSKKPEQIRNFPLTLNAFRRLLTLKRDGQSERWWSWYRASRKYTVHPKLSSYKGWQDKFFLLSVPDDFPIRRTFYRPHPRFDTISKRELDQHELRVVSHFDIVESEDDKGRPRLTPKVWMPNVGYILDNAPLSHVMSNQWIECPEGRLSGEVVKRFSVLDGHLGDRWQPELDVSWNESLFANDPMRGGNLGCWLLRNLAPPMDKLAGAIGPLAAQHMHDLMKAIMSGTEVVEMYRQHHQSSLDNAGKVISKIREAKQKDDLEMAALRDKVAKLEGFEKDVQLLKNQIAEKSKDVERIPLLEKDLSDAKVSIQNMEEKVKKMEADKPIIRQRAVGSYLTSAEFATKLQDRFGGGWTTA
ncbi:uncharacterized protein LOC110713096 [Chenopodium quinoa]|uniref:uncharacterized protein LOC110713096 n=1 Tax=Chenopodium quinoa TaxID=63459 RepID=UPI000B79551E|nr:uncharacterized protein LOC110713096 [Chenopodium quinoa]